MDQVDAIARAPTTSKTAKSVDIAQTLLALSARYESFSAAALSCIWLPVSSVECASFFLKHNLVVSDMRQSLTESNIQIMTSSSFNKFSDNCMSFENAMKASDIDDDDD